MRSIVVLLGQLIMVAMAVFLADLAQSSISFIPSAIIKLPEVDYTAQDFRVVLLYVLCAHALVLGANHLLNGPWNPRLPERAASELYALAAAFSISSLLVFTTTSVAFDPNFIVGIAVINIVLFLLASVILSMAGTLPIGQYCASLLWSVFRKAITLQGILIIVLALSPGLLAKLFVSNKDVANVITQLRIYFTGQSSTPYELANALGQLKLDQPMLVKESPAGENRVYILERGGRLISVGYPEGENPKTELDIREKVGPAEIENGALGFAFAPDTGSELTVFVYYTSVSDGEQENRLSKFTLGTGDLAEVSASEVPLMILPRENSGFHNGGSVEFGPDGYLYLAIGEGVNPKGQRAQNVTLRGGIIRIDIDCPANGANLPVTRQPLEGKTDNYCIPADNPFIDQDAVLPEYWVLGLRNPFRIGFDSANGEIWAGDVGSTKWEEVNRIERGANYQFPWVEGNEATDKARPLLVVGTETGPVYTYVHTAYDRAVIGGHVYRGDLFPDLEGKYLFADNYSSKLFAMDIETPDPEPTHIATADQFAQRGTSSVNVLSNGDILVTTLGRSAVASGEVLRLQPKGSDPEGSIGSAVSTSSQNNVAYSSDEIQGIYVANCARCHGLEGMGDGPDTPELGIPVPDFTRADFQSTRSDEQLRAIINEGGYPLGMSPLMPPWAHILNEAEIAGLVDWIRAR